MTGLGVLRALGQAGVVAYVAGNADGLVRSSRWYRSLDKPNQPHATEETLASYLNTFSALDVPQTVLMPCSDSWVTAVGDLPPGLAQRFPSSIPPADILRLFVDKACFAETLVRFDIPHPATVPIRDAAHLDAFGDELLRTHFLKPTRSRRFASRFRRKGVWLTDRAEARAILAETQAMGIGLMLQEFIPGPPTRHVFIDGFIDRHGRVGGLFGRRRLRMYPAEFGNSTLTESVPLAELREARDSVLRLLQAVRYRGIFSAEFKHDARDGVFKILEVNARPWWFIAFAANSGVNVAHMAYRDALGLDVTRVDGYRVGRRCVYPRRDLQSRHTIPLADRPGLLSVLRSWIGAEPIILSWRDPKPGLRESWIRSRSWLSRKLAWRTAR